MLENEERPTLTLKNGSEVDGIRAYLVWRRLADLAPEELRAFVALAKGEGDQVSPDMRNAVTQYRSWFAGESLEPVFQNVVLSAVRDGADGPVVVTPFVAKNEQDVDALARIQRRANLLMGEFANQLSDSLLDKNKTPLTRQVGRDVRRLSNDLFKEDEPPEHSKRR